MKFNVIYRNHAGTPKAVEVSVHETTDHRWLGTAYNARNLEVLGCGKNAPSPIEAVELLMRDHGEVVAIEKLPRYVLPSTAGNWSAQDPDFKRFFGLDPKHKWPKEGIVLADGSTRDVFIEGRLGKVRLWVDPLVQGVTRHRLQCQCPKCGAVMSAGRIEQHAKKLHPKEA